MSNTINNKRKFYVAIALISTVGMFAWFLTEDRGGMTIYLLSYGFLIIPLLILYIISFVETLIGIFKRGFRHHAIKVIAHALLLISITAIHLAKSEVLRSKAILSATLKDDLFDYTLIFRENGQCENIINGMFGFREIHFGNYHFSGDTIIFEKVPFDTHNFLKERILISRKDSVLFIERDSLNHFVTEIRWLNHFKMNRLN